MLDFFYVIGGRDGNSRNYVVKGTKGSGQD